MEETPEKILARPDVDPLPIQSFSFTLILTDKVSLPPFKGDLFHRLLGKSLAGLQPSIGRLFFKPPWPPRWNATRQTPPSPFVLIPPLTTQTRFFAGETLDFGLTLFGNATPHWLSVLLALDRLGTSDGLLGNSGRFLLTQVQQLTPQGSRLLYANHHWHHHPLPLTSHRLMTCPATAVSRLRLQLLTPLRLKHQGRLVRQAPPLAVVMERLTGRLNTLGSLYGAGPLLSPEARHALITLAHGVPPPDDHSQWREWPRQEAGGMRFGGLEGYLDYDTPPPQLLPWLHLGQWTGLGAKTSFGLGLVATETESVEFA